MQTTEDPSIAAIVGSSPQILDLKQAVLRIAPRNTTVLITGETGTGKELFAQALHQGSLRRFKPFVRVNCAAIPEALLESELFGYAEGTFTGGKKGGYPGKFAIADGGTVFLDELAELPVLLQAKLLRFLQEHEIQRLGETMPRKLNVRVVAATNANLAQLVKYKKFRSDLYYRLNVVMLEIPPLRNRREDIGALSQVFLRQLSEEYSYRVYRLSPELEQIFDTYPWPGNVRELYNIMETAFNLHDGSQELSAEHLPQYLRQWRLEQAERAKQSEFPYPAAVKGRRELERIGRTTGRAMKLFTREAPWRTEEREMAKGLERKQESEGISEGEAQGGAGANEVEKAWEQWISLVGQRSLTEITDLFEGELLSHLVYSGHNRTHLAALLRISRQALYTKLRKYHLQ